MVKKSKLARGYFRDLPGDVLQGVALILPVRDRHKINLVCRAWRDGLRHAPGCWEVALIDSRQLVRTSRRRPLKKAAYLPTTEAILAWFSAYCTQIRRVRFSNLDDTALQAGCLGATGIAAALQAAAPSLETVCFVDCCLPALLGTPLEALCSLPRLRQLELNLPDLEHAWTAGAFECLTRLTAVQELRLAASPAHRQWLPAGLSALSSLRVLSVETPHRAELVLPRELAALAPMLQELSIENHVLLSPHAEVVHAHLVCADQVCAFTALTSLRLAGCDLGSELYAHLRGGACRLPPALTRLSALRSLELLRHKLSASELATVARLTTLTSLALSADHRRVTHEIPTDFSAMTNLRSLQISHALQQVPPAITGLTSLTYLDLCFNRLHTLKPGPYLKNLVVVKLGANEYRTWPKQLGAAKESVVQIHLHMNEGLEIADKDVAQLAAFPKLRWIVAFGASESGKTKRCLQLLTRTAPWIQVLRTKRRQQKLRWRVRTIATAGAGPRQRALAWKTEREHDAGRPVLTGAGWDGGPPSVPHVNPDFFNVYFAGAQLAVVLCSMPGRLLGMEVRPRKFNRDYILSVTDEAAKRRQALRGKKPTSAFIGRPRLTDHSWEKMWDSHLHWKRWTQERMGPLYAP